MSTGSLKRKLTAILYADVAGYSRLTGVDEEGTHRRVMEELDFASAQIHSGSGVNLVARLEAAAPEGGICI